jgi:hypothetical protein
VTDLLGFSQKVLSDKLKSSTKLPDKGEEHRLRARRALNSLLASAAAGDLAALLRTLRGVPSVHVFAPDCLADLALAADSVEAGQHDTYKAALDALRLSRRFVDRSARLQCSSHTLLVKGLEFERCIVVDAHQLKTKQHLYVALTRGSSELLVVSSSPTIGG